ncbi:MAG TPA: TetR/AcrR family transcriptional regulator [Pseudomonadales bacterium]|nr:TetR/AcrR family transcriptional regulator [Pseudomonadales bacterium]
MNQKKIWIRKPLQQRSKAKFDAVLAALPQVLHQCGWRKTTTAQLALEADISIGSLYNYFSCKDAVLLAYLDDRLHVALDSVLHAVSESDFDPYRFIRAFVSSGVDFAYEHRDVLRIALQVFPEKMLDPDLADSRAKLLQIINQSAAKKTFTLKKRDPRLATYTLANIILGFQFRTVVMPDEGLKREAVVEELSEIIANYLFDK